MGACCTLESGKAGVSKQPRPTTPKSARRKSDVQVASTTLHDAAWEGNINMVRIFLSKGHSPDLPDEEGSTPLHLASEEGHMQVVKCLLEGKATCADAADSDGNTPLLLAAKEGRDEVVEYFLTQATLQRSCMVERGRLYAVYVMSLARSYNMHCAVLHDVESLVQRGQGGSGYTTCIRNHRVPFCVPGPVPSLLIVHHTLQP
ncbi:unnamed protein product [Durusdinium trenchii]|uniref:Uncharacterized protein n=1 Tax=Durusdinium trenchii TaxID=1381693 RepID=A0ABP0NDA4_9DINO